MTVHEEKRPAAAGMFCDSYPFRRGNPSLRTSSPVLRTSLKRRQQQAESEDELKFEEHMKATRALIAILAAFTAFTGTADSEMKAVRKTPSAIRDSYIVTFKSDNVRISDIAGTGRELVARHGAKLVHIYGDALAGMAVRMSPKAAEAMLLDPRVEAIEEDGPIWVAGIQGAPVSKALDRIDQDPLPLSSSYTYNYTGYTTTIYIIDTGIKAHRDYEGRLIGARNFWTNRGTLNDPNRTEDCARHGSGVAGVAAGTKYGVAKGALLFSVKAYGCHTTDSSVSDYVAAVNWVASEKRANPTRVMVANFSLIAFPSTALDNAVIDLVSAGVTTVVAAGNSNDSACNWSPGRLGNPNSYPVNPNGYSTITVGATNPDDDTRAPFSSFGTCVDIFAPGMAGLTADPHEGYDAEAGTEGTSFAAPLVAGVAALHLEKDPGSPATIESRIKGFATQNRIIGPGSGSPNLLLYTFYRRVRACCS
jgi:subtilisin family serine protease